MAKMNQNKAISANSNGIVISFRDANKNKFIPYENEFVENIQVRGTVKYQKLEKALVFNPTQHDLYQKIVYGFKAYTPEQISAMNEKTKVRVTVTYTKAHRMLKKWKQNIIGKLVDDALKALFPHSKIVEQITSIEENYSNDVDDTISFHEVGITKRQIVDKLVETGFLPKNFYQLT